MTDKMTKTRTKRKTVAAAEDTADKISNTQSKRKAVAAEEDPARPWKKAKENEEEEIAIIRLTPSEPRCPEAMRVEVRGQRCEDGMFFKFNDVCAILHASADTVRKQLSRNNCGEELETWFRLHDGKKFRELRFLTMAGLFQVYGSSGTRLARKLYEWAVIIANPPTPSIPNVRTVLGLACRPMSGIYFIILGSVAALRESMAVPHDKRGSLLVVKFGQAKDIGQRLGQHEAHFAPLAGTSLQVKSLLVADEDELNEAEAGVRLWFEENAEPLVPTGPQRLRGGGKRDVQYKEVVLLAPESLTRTAAYFAQQQKHFARDGAANRELIKALESRAEGHAREIKHFADMTRLYEILVAGSRAPTTN
ncbi:hypothetical protein HDU87_001143 [Geranomyces variabilis]|uniref:Bro-N domain-containing protein n=1 Tax=Geranomyces variabilis TaxID=109894 RepID=A0AAD5TBX5_9FUNG|nr:hypothetical protein HDU87_001143 [Geranomyces variabilis]